MDLNSSAGSGTEKKRKREREKEKEAPGHIVDSGATYTDGHRCCDHARFTPDHERSTGPPVPGTAAAECRGGSSRVRR